MRILYIDHHAAAPASGGDTRAYELARQWQLSGDEVTVLTAGYSHKRRQNPELTEDFTEKKYGEVRFCYLLAPSYERGVGGINRNITAFIKKLYLQAPLIAERFRPEIIICAGGYPFDFYCIQRAAKLCHAKLVFEMRVLWPLLQRELYPAGESRISRAVADYAMDHALRSADLVASLLTGGERYCRMREITPKNYCLLLAGVQPLPEAAPLRQEDASALDALRQKYPFLVAYAGRLTSRRKPELLGAAMGGLAKDGIGAVIAGNGGYKLLLSRMIKEKGMDNVLLLDAQNEHRQQSIYEAADAIFYGDARELSGKFGAYSPLLLQMMQQGKPLAMAVQGDRNPAQLCECGVTGDTPLMMMKALRSLAAMPPEERRAMGERGLREITEHHMPEQVAHAYREALLRLWA